MSRIVKLSMILAATAGFAVLSTGAIAQKAGSCVMAGGEATMITGDLAKFMANAALKNSISGKGLKASGDVKMTCKDGIANVHCVAKQKACK
jgi:hypothetical protein